MCCPRARPLLWGPSWGGLGTLTVLPQNLVPVRRPGRHWCLNVAGATGVRGTPRASRDQTGSRKLSPTKHQKVVPSADKRMEHGGHAALREGSSLRLLLDDICARWDSSCGQEAGHPLPGPMGTNGRLPGPERPVGIRYTVYLNTSSSREGKDPVQGNHQLQTAFRLQNTQVKHVPWDQERRRLNSKVLVNEPFERTYAGRAGRSRGPREQWQGHAGKACAPVR